MNGNDELLPADFADRVLARVDRDRRRSRLWRAGAAVAGLTAVALVLALPRPPRDVAKLPASAVALASALPLADVEESVALVDAADDVVDEDPGAEFFPDAQ